MINFPIQKKKSLFRHEMLHYKLGHLKNFDKSKIDQYEKEVHDIMEGLNEKRFSFKVFDMDYKTKKYYI